MTEILVALAIVAVMVATMSTTMIGYWRESQISTLATSLNAMQTGIIQFRTNVTRYPSRLYNLQITPIGEKDLCGIVNISFTNANNWRGPYFTLQPIGQPDTVGFAQGDWIVNDTLVRTPTTASSTTSTGRLDIQIPEMRVEDANELNDLVDGPSTAVPPQSGNTDTAGTVRWGTVTSGLTRVKYGFVIAGC